MVMLMHAIDFLRGNHINCMLETITIIHGPCSLHDACYCSLKFSLNAVSGALIVTSSYIQFWNATKTCLYPMTFPVHFLQFIVLVAVIIRRVFCGKFGESTFTRNLGWQFTAASTRIHAQRRRKFFLVMGGLAILSRGSLQFYGFQQNPDAFAPQSRTSPNGCALLCTAPVLLVKTSWQCQSF